MSTGSSLSGSWHPSSIAPRSPGPSGHLALALAAEDLLPIGRRHQAPEVQLAVDHLRLTWESTVFWALQSGTM